MPQFLLLNCLFCCCFFVWKLIVRLKKEIESLKKELALVTGEQRRDKLNQEEIQQYVPINSSILNLLQT